MYHYRECGLPNVYLKNGYRKIDTAHGTCVAIQDVEGLHAAIAHTIINEDPFLSGPEVRFIRKYLDLTQAEMGAYLGVDEQTIRRWERIGRIPKQGDLAVRLLFRDLTGQSSQKLPLPQFVQHIGNAAPIENVHYHFRQRSKAPWQPKLNAA